MLSVAEVGRLFDEDTRNAIASGLCVTCRAAKLLCGKPRCPILVKYDSMMKTQPLIDDTALDGSSPPGVFVGRFGYPKVFLGPLIAPGQESGRGGYKGARTLRRADSAADLRARPAVVGRCRGGSGVSKIQRAFSGGPFGLGQSRRSAPRCWPVTAVAATIRKELRER